MMKATPRTGLAQAPRSSAGARIVELRRGNLRGLGVSDSDSRRKEDIVQAAELLFSRNAYDAVSIRDISAAAKVNSALIRYHFGTKAQLYRMLFERRYSSITERRLAALRSLDVMPGSATSVAAIVKIWAVPLLELASARGSQNFVNLLAHESNDAAHDRRGIFFDYLDPSALICIAALRRALPGADERDVIQVYLWMMAVTMSTIAAGPRADRLCSGASSGGAPAAASRKLVAFVTRGILSMIFAPAGGEPFDG